MSVTGTHTAATPLIIGLPPSRRSRREYGPGGRTAHRAEGQQLAVGFLAPGFRQRVTIVGALRLLMVMSFTAPTEPALVTSTSSLVPARSGLAMMRLRSTVPCCLRSTSALCASVAG